MTAEEFGFSKYLNRHIEISFKDGSITDGVISYLLNDSPHTLFFIHASNMREFQSKKKDNDQVAMKKLCSEVDFSLIKSVSLI